MKLNDLVQGTPEWHAWRAGLAMASEAAVIMDAAPTWAPVKTWSDLRAAKVGLEASRSDFLDKAAERGKDEEEKARFIVCPTHRPVCATAPRGVYGASLDGWDADMRSWVEIKCPMKGVDSTAFKLAAADHASTDLRSRIQEHVWFQLVHQAHVVGKKNADHAILIIWGGFVEDIEAEGVSESPYIDMVVPIDVLLEDWPMLEERWKSFLAGEAPGRHDAPWELAARQWLDAEARLKEAKADQDAARKALVELSADGDGSKGAGVKVTESTRQGNVDWPKYAAEKLHGGDVKEATKDAESYRKPASTFHRISAL